MEFTTEMPRIAHEINRAAQERAGRLCRIRADTHQFLAGARADLLDMAEVQDAVRESQRAAALLQEAHRKQAGGEAAGKRRREVHRLRAQTKRFLREAGRRHEEVSNRTKDGLVHFVDDLRSGVHGNLQEFAADFRRGGRLFRKTLMQTATFAEQPARAKAHDAPRPASHRGFPTSGRRAAHRAAHA